MGSGWHSLTRRSPGLCPLIVWTEARPFPFLPSTAKGITQASISCLQSIRKPSQSQPNGTVIDRKWKRWVIWMIPVAISLSCACYWCCHSLPFLLTPWKPWRRMLEETHGIWRLYSLTSEFSTHLGQFWIFTDGSCVVRVWVSVYTTQEVTLRLVEHNCKRKPVLNHSVFVLLGGDTLLPASQLSTGKCCSRTLLLPKWQYLL